MLASLSVLLVLQLALLGTCPAPTVADAGLQHVAQLVAEEPPKGRAAKVDTAGTFTNGMREVIFRASLSVLAVILHT